MKVSRKIIDIDEALCDGCGQCVVDCEEAALQIVDGKAKLVKEMYCDGLGACIGTLALFWLLAGHRRAGLSLFVLVPLALASVHMASR